MGKKLSTIIFSFVLVFSLVSSSGGFDNNKENYDKNKEEWIPYEPANINNGTLKGGHDTITYASCSILKI